MSRKTFLTWFVIVLALAVAAAFAWRAGALFAIWTADQSRMTSVIALVVVIAAARLGHSAWLVDEGHVVMTADGHFAERAAVMLGMLGTTIGLSLQAAALAVGGGASFAALSTSLYTTGAGIAGALTIGAMTHVVERGQARR